MAKIQEAREKGTGGGKFFTSKEIVGQPFEIMGDVNANSDFPETEKKEGKKGTWLIIGIKLGGEEKELHLTNSAMRALRDCLPVGIASWKGQRAVMNYDAKGFSPAKFTRLMGDYAAVPGQGQLTDIPKPQAPVAANYDFPQSQESMQQKVGRFLAGIGRDVGVHDSRIQDKLIEVFGTQEQAVFIFGMLKQSGQVMQKPNGCWVWVK